MALPPPPLSPPILSFIFATPFFLFYAGCSSRTLSTTTCMYVARKEHSVAPPPPPPHSLFFFVSLLFPTPLLAQIAYTRYMLQTENKPTAPFPNVTYATRVTLDVYSPSLGSFSTFVFVRDGWGGKERACFPSLAHPSITHRSRTLTSQIKAPCSCSNGSRTASTTPR